MNLDKQKIMKQTIEIEVPDGKKAVWKEGKVVFEDIKPKLPKTWIEFCNQNKIRKGEIFFNDVCDMMDGRAFGDIRDSYIDRNILPSEQAVKQHLALMQLHQLRDCYRQGWTPTVDKVLFGITRRVGGNLKADKFMFSSRFLSFQSKEIAQEFLNNFRNLIEQAGDLI